VQERSPQELRIALFVDATGVLQNFGSAPTGIPRVEDALVRAALADPAATVVRFDRRLRAFRALNQPEQRLLRENADAVEFGPGGPLQTIRRILDLIGRSPTVSRDADRHFADLATGNRRRGFSYAAAKFLFRMYRLFRLALAQVSLLRAADPIGALDCRSGIVLLSNTVILGSRLNRVLDATTRRAFICHDLIPILRPEFAIDPEHARRFSENIEQLLRLGAEVLCTSQASQTMVAEFVRDSRIAAPSLHRFPMPSILHEKVAQFGGASPARVDEPFILYCSTIEVRKNHLLLARVWQRALDEGAALPKLICVGKWGWGADELIAYLAAHPALSSCIAFVGPVGDSELIEYYRRALFGVVPSRMEGWGYSASECLDFGLPVIISTTPALGEATHGIMPAVDPDDEIGWHAQIRRMTEDHEWRAALRGKIAERHRPTPTALSWSQIKDALLRSRPYASAAERMSTAAARPACPLSVVVSTRDRASDILPALGGLANQVRAVGGELIVVSGADDDSDSGSAAGDIRIHRLPGASIFDCRAAALSLASADIVALTEDHCIQAEDWCARIIENFALNPGLVLLGGSVANGSTRRIDDLMNYWMTFATFAPGQVTARHPCIAQFIVRASAIKRALRPGELESSIIEKFEKVPGAVYVDPQLCVRHVQSHGFWSTFTVHFHNGRATAGLSPRRSGDRDLSVLKSLGWTWKDAKAHLRRLAAAFRLGTKSATRTAGYLILILPLVVAHGIGEYVGYRRGPGSSLDRLV
jgi:glycosyltransferase involved in cell wall biosynthesis